MLCMGWGRWRGGGCLLRAGSAARCWLQRCCQPFKQLWLRLRRCRLLLQACKQAKEGLAATRAAAGGQAGGAGPLHVLAELRAALGTCAYDRQTPRNPTRSQAV